MSYNLCPKCGYPNKAESEVCGFCRKSLRKARVIPFRVSNHTGSPRQGYRSRDRTRPGLSTFSSQVLKGIVGGALFSIGGYLFYLSVTTSNFKLWLISLLGVLYGFQLLRPLWKGR